MSGRPSVMLGGLPRGIAIAQAGRTAPSWHGGYPSYMRQRGGPYETVPGLGARDPEERLWLAVFAQALADSASASAYLRGAAVGWLCDRGDAVQSVGWVLAQLELDGHAPASLRLTGGKCSRYQRQLGPGEPVCATCEAPITADRLYCDPHCRKQAEYRQRRRQRRSAA